jgi:hypothetical protein
MVMEFSGNTVRAASVGPDMETTGKKPPAPSVTRRPDINAQIANAVYRTLEPLDAEAAPLPIVAS